MLASLIVLWVVIILEASSVSAASILSMRSLEFHLVISFGRDSSLSEKSSAGATEHMNLTSIKYSWLLLSLTQSVNSDVNSRCPALPRLHKVCKYSNSAEAFCQSKRKLLFFFLKENLLNSGVLGKRKTWSAQMPCVDRNPKEYVWSKSIELSCCYF